MTTFQQMISRRILLCNCCTFAVFFVNAMLFIKNRAGLNQKQGKKFQTDFKTGLKREKNLVFRASPSAGTCRSIPRSRSVAVKIETLTSISIHKF